MTHIAVLVQVETRCPRCGGAMVRMGTAAITPDGRIGEVLSGPADDDVCNDCGDRERAEHVRKLATRLLWKKGKPRLAR